MTLWYWLHIPLFVVGNLLVDAFDVFGFIVAMIIYGLTYILCVRIDLHRD